VFTAHLQVQEERPDQLDDGPADDEVLLNLGVGEP